jgi:hypothetical protein
MTRRLPRSFFWIDQQIIRSGLWMQLSLTARLAYIALSASCDRDGISIWSRSKLMALSGCVDPDEWPGTLIELEGHRLVESLESHVPPAMKLLPLEAEQSSEADRTTAQVPAASITSPKSAPSVAPVIVHTHTTVHLGGKAPYVESRSSD